MFLWSCWILTIGLLPLHVCGDCGPPPEGQYARHDVSSPTSPVNTVAMYVCSAGYRALDGGNSITCQENNQWTTLTLVCGPEPCGDPGTPENGRRTNVAHSFPNQIDFFCDEGYSMVGQSYRLCQAHGEWSGTTPRCDPVECPELAAPLHGSLSTNDHTYGTQAMFTCDASYSYEGTATRVCEATGQWSGVAGECQKNFCPKILLPYGTILGEPGSEALTTKYFSCFDNATISGETESICLESGIWDPAPPTCNAKCTRPVITNGGFGATGDTFIHMDVGSVNCFNGFTIDGQADIQCTNGTWTPALPVCIEVTTTTSTTTSTTTVISTPTTLPSTRQTSQSSPKPPANSGAVFLATLIWTFHHVGEYYM